MSQWIPRLSQLEEGNVGSILQHMNLSRYTSSVLFRAYVISAAWWLLIVVVRPMPVLELPLEPLSVATSESFHHVVSNPVPNDKVRRSTHARLMRSEEECIAAVHLGLPVQQMRVGNMTLTNPVVVRQGSHISKAYETSLFYPERPSKLIHRYLPVTVRFYNIEGDHVEETYDGKDGHCVLHMLNQFRGRSIYEE